MTISSNYELENLGQKTQQELHRDSIAQVYLQKTGDSETQHRARERINYIDDEIKLGKVLDIGCSEGITAIKAAEKGCQVKAIDIHPEAIAFAIELASKMLGDAENKPDFSVVDIFSLEEIKPEFDTVVLGEVIEHVFEPHNMLKRACLALKVGGKLVVTTPWGYMPAPDHHQTFFLTSFLNIIPESIITESLEIKDDYIRFTGVQSYDPTIDTVEKDLSNASIIEATELLNKTETAALESQEFLRGIIENKQRRLELSWKAIDTLKGDFVGYRTKHLLKKIKHSLKRILRR